MAPTIRNLTKKLLIETCDPGHKILGKEVHGRQLGAGLQKAGFPKRSSTASFTSNCPPKDREGLSSIKKEQGREINNTLHCSQNGPTQPQTLTPTWLYPNGVPHFAFPMPLFPEY